MTENESMIDFGQMSDTSKMDTPTVQPKVQLPLTTTLLQVFLLVTTIALLHFASLSYPLTADSPDIINNSVLQSYVQDLKDPANYSQPYSIIKLSYIIDYALFGTSASGFRLVNVLLHTLNTILLFFFLFLLLINVSQEQEGKQELSTLSWASFCVALLFAVHPLSVFATTYVIQRPILLATFYCLLSLLAFFQGVLKQKFVWFFLSALAYGFALYSSERALFFMFVPLLFLPLIVTAEKGRASYVFVMILINLLTAIQFTASQWSGLALVHEPWMNKLVAYASPDIANKLFSASLDSASYHMSLLQQAWLYFRYLFLSFFPDLKQLTVLVPISPPTSWFSGPELFGCLLFVLYPIGPIKLISRKGFLGIVGAALFIPWILFIPELTI
ncbi:MAG TPA: hypothetical protein VJC18_09700, partial [bacterium]|nr:hypothetical protein [bacterium]